MRTSRSRSALLPALLALATLARSASAQDPAAGRPKVEALLAEEMGRWYPRALDRDLGGFHQTFSRDWSPLPDDNRFLVYQCRVTWTAAAYAAHAPARRDEFLGYARYGIEYLDRVMRDRESGGFHWILTPRGEVDPRLGAEKHAYGVAFVLYTASKVHEVARDDLSRKVARDAFDWLEAHAHDAEHGGYFEAFARDGTPILAGDGKTPPRDRVDRLGVYYGFKSMNTHIHLLEGLAAYVRIERTPAVEARLREVLGLVRDRIAVEPGALNLYFTRDWRATPAHDSFGHDVETAYLLVEAAEALGIHDDPATWRVARSLVDHALDWGWDDQHGGFYDKGDAFAGKAYDTTKVWWTQAEGLNSLLLLDRKYGGQTDRYRRAFAGQWRFIQDHQIDPVHGGWFGEVTREGRLIGDGRKATQWRANYHTGRALMNVSRALGATPD